MSPLALRVCSVRRATPSTRIIRLDLNGARFPYEAGQLAMLGRADDELRVPYSIASAPAETERAGYLEFLTRMDAASRLREVARGERLLVDGPYGSFTLPPGAGSRDLLFVAGGTGIAPLRSMIREAVLTMRGSKLRLLYSARRPDEFPYLTELRGLARRKQIELALTATREVPSRWRGDRGRITPEKLASLIDTTDLLCFVCGPMSMVDEVPRMLRDLGVESRRIRIEEW